jgi:hypothetical protein
MIRTKVGSKVVITRKKIIDHFKQIGCGPNGVITEIIPDFWKGSAWASRQRHPHLAGYRIAFDDLVERNEALFGRGNVYHRDEFKGR